MPFELRVNPNSYPSAVMPGASLEQSMQYTTACGRAHQDVGGYAISPTAEAIQRASDRASQLASVVDGLFARLQPALSPPLPATPSDARPTSDTDLVREIDNLADAFEWQTARLREMLTRLAL